MSDRPSGGGTILLIEDDAIAATNLRDGLIRFGYAVRAVASAEAALAAFESPNMELILISLMPQDTDGLILCSSLRARTTAPIFVLSARPREVDRLLAVELGATDFVSVPIALDELLPRVEAAIGQARRSRTGGERTLSV